MKITAIFKIDDSAWDSNIKYGLLELELKRDSLGTLYWTWREIEDEYRWGAFNKWGSDKSIFNDQSILEGKKIVPRVIARKSRYDTETSDESGSPVFLYKDGDI